ncbi:MAG: GNAT family N-acetyltransferase [Acidobacteria bacterium]|nr:GNAT family N-acetyltransferase [Acidobacteriota bacterium]
MVRLLTLDAVPSVIELSAAAGWNQTPEDWSRMIRLEPEGCFCIERDGRVVATATLLCFGAELAWIGMVLTHRDYQRRGFARRLMSAAVDTARGRGVRSVKLDATDQGHALYESFGFVDEQPIERWRREPRPAEPEPAATGPVPHALDREACGVDRSRFIDALPGPVRACDEAYALTRPGARANYAGPIVARHPRDADRLLASLLDDGAWYLDLLPSNQAARIIASEHGFAPVRHLTRMRLGQPIQTRDDYVFGIAGFEAG